MNNYIIANRRNLTASRNSQFAACMGERRPFVTVVNARRYASVELDLFPIRGCFDDPTQSRIEALLDQMSEPGAIVRIGTMSCSTSKVRVDVAEELAEKLYRLGRGVAR